MTRWIACGLSATGMAAAADPVPVSVYPPVPAVEAPAPPPTPAPTSNLPGTVVPMPTSATPVSTGTGAADVTRPLSTVLEAPAQGVPTLVPPATVIAGPTTCVGGYGIPVEESRWGIPKLGRLTGAMPCLDRLCNYFAWSPGPRVVPVLTPTPYHPPLRHYLPAATCSAPTAVVAGPAPIFGARLFGLHGSGSAQSCRPGGRRCDPCHENVIDKAIGKLTPRQFGNRADCHTYAGAPVSACAGGNCGPGAVTVPAGGPVAPAVGGIYPGVTGGYRFASPVFVPPAPMVTASAARVVAPAVAAPGTALPAAAPAPPGSATAAPISEKK